MSTHLSKHSWIDHDEGNPNLDRSGLSRRDFCKGLGVMGATVLLGGCESFPQLGLQAQLGAENGNASLLTPDQFAEKAGTVETARANAVRGIEASNEFLQRFLLPHCGHARDHGANLRQRASLEATRGARDALTAAGRQRPTAGALRHAGGRRVGGPAPVGPRQMGTATAP